MNADLEALVERVIDEAIRTFEPREPTSFDRWNSELQRLESLLREEESLPDSQGLLATVQARRIAMAFEIARFDLVIAQSSQFVRAFPTIHPSFSNIANLRSCALHATGAHAAEIEETIAMARRPEVRGSEYVYLLAILSKQHPGCLPADEALSQKLQETIKDLQDQGYDTLPRSVNDPMQLEEMAGRIADELRRVNRERGEALLNEPA
jgi:hypothetical protein